MVVNCIDDFGVLLSVLQRDAGMYDLVNTEECGCDIPYYSSLLDGVCECAYSRCLRFLLAHCMGKERKDTLNNLRSVVTISKLTDCMKMFELVVSVLTIDGFCRRSCYSPDPQVFSLLFGPEDGYMYKPKCLSDVDNHICFIFNCYLYLLSVNVELYSDRLKSCERKEYLDRVEKLDRIATCVHEDVDDFYSVGDWFNEDLVLVDQFCDGILTYLDTVAEYKRCSVSECFPDCILVADFYSQGVSASKTEEEKVEQKMDEITKDMGQPNEKHGFFKTIADWISRKFWSIVGWFGDVGDSIKKFFQSIIDYFADIPGKIVDLLSDAAKERIIQWWGTCQPMLKVVGLFALATIAFLLGLMSDRVLGLISHALYHKSGYQAQTSDNVSGGANLVGLVGALLASSVAGFGDVRKAAAFARDSLSVINLGSGLSRILVSLYNILPNVVRRFVARFFGDKTDLVQDEVNECVLDWTALSEVAWNPRLNQTDEYLGELSSLIRRLAVATRACEEARLNSATCSLVSRTLSDAMRMYGQLSTGSVTGVARPFPLWVHIYGEPGVGKTVLLEAIKSDAPGHMVDPRSDLTYSSVCTYSRNSTDKFWSGYNCTHKIVVWDEFLNANSSTPIEQAATEMLVLASSNEYLLNMSANEPSGVGMKGTPFESDMIITCNNQFGTGLTGNIDSGLKRRRNIVVRLEPSPEYAKYFKNGAWTEVEKYNEDRKQGKHLVYKVVKWVSHSNGRETKDAEEVVQVTFKTLREFLDYLWEQQAAQAHISNLILGTQGGVPKVDESILEAKRRVRGLVNRSPFKEVKPEGLECQSGPIERHMMVPSEQSSPESDSGTAREVDSGNDSVKKQEDGEAKPKTLPNWQLRADRLYPDDEPEEVEEVQVEEVYSDGSQPSVEEVVQEVVDQMVETVAVNLEREDEVKNEESDADDEVEIPTPPTAEQQAEITADLVKFSRTVKYERKKNEEGEFIETESEFKRRIAETLSDVGQISISLPKNFNFEKFAERAKKFPLCNAYETDCDRRQLFLSCLSITLKEADLPVREQVKDWFKRRVTTKSNDCIITHSGGCNFCFSKSYKDQANDSAFPIVSCSGAYAVCFPREVGAYVSTVPFHNCYGAVCLEHGIRCCTMCERMIYYNDMFAFLLQVVRNSLVKANIRVDGYLNAISASLVMKHLGIATPPIFDRSGNSIIAVDYMYGVVKNKDGLPVLCKPEDIEPLLVPCYCYAAFNSHAWCFDYKSKQTFAHCKSLYMPSSREAVRVLKGYNRAVWYKLSHGEVGFNPYARKDVREIDSDQERDVESVQSRIPPNPTEIPVRTEVVNDGKLDIEVVMQEVHEKPIPIPSERAQELMEDFLTKDESRKLLHGYSEYVETLKCLDVIPSKYLFENAFPRTEAGSAGRVFSNILLGVLGVSVFGTLMFSLASMIARVLRKDDPKREDYEPCFAEGKYSQTEAGKISSKKGEFKVRRRGVPSEQAKKIVWVQFDGCGCSFRAIPVGGKYFITMAHGIRNFAETTGNFMMTTRSGNTYSGDISLSNIVDMEEKDLVMFLYESKQMSMYPEVSSLFINNSDLARFKHAGQGWWCCADFGKGTSTGYTTYLEHVNYQIDNEYHTFSETAIYTCLTEAGFCGTPVMIRSPKGDMKCLGFHVAGNQRTSSNPRAICQIVTSDDLKNLREAFYEQGIPINKTENDLTNLQIQSLDQIDGPNLRSVSIIPYRERVFVPEKQNIVASPIQELDKFVISKAPSIVSRDDPRANGKDPMEAGLQTLATWGQPEVDEELVRCVAKDLAEFFKSRVTDHNLDRELTLTEAVGGVAHVNSMNMKSSLGFPLCIDYPGGKKQLITLQSNEAPLISDRFRQEVKVVEQKLKDPSFCNENNYFRFLAYCKVETQKLSKIEKVATRLTYCGNAALTAYARMKFGCLFERLNNTCPSWSLSGLNQYSTDLQKVYDYLVEVMDVKHNRENFIAGDYSKFDQHYIRVFQEYAYRVLYDLLPESLKNEENEVIWKNFVKTQIDAPVQAGDHLYFFECAHFSGCVFTTLINNIVNQMYMRYLFAKVYPGIPFDSVVRMVQQGDDHIICVNREYCEDFNQSYIEYHMSLLNQVYTNEEKDGRDVGKFRKFEDVSILGSHPTQIDGLWCGKMRKSTIENAICWMRSGEFEAWRDTCLSMLCYASMWEETYFQFVKSVINTALRARGDKPFYVSYGIRRVVAYRAAMFDKMCDVFYAQSYTEFSGAGEVVQENVPSTVPIEGGGFGGTDDDLVDGCNSFLYKTSFVWDKTLARGEYLLLPVEGQGFPLSIMTKSKDDPQAVKMREFVAYRSDFEIRVQTNGNKIQQGALDLFFLPLVSGDYRITYKDWLTIPHMVISPVNTEDLVYEIPFRYPYQFDRTLDKEGIGQLYIGCLSPLTYVSGSPVTVTIYIRMKNYEFKVAHPITPEDKFVAEGEDLPAEPVKQPEPEKKVEEKTPEKIIPKVDRSKKPKNVMDFSKLKKVKMGSKTKSKKKGMKKVGSHKHKPDRGAFNRQVGKNNGAHTTVTINRFKGGKGVKKGGRKFMSKKKSKHYKKSLSSQEKVQQSWNNYVKRFGEAPAVSDGEFAYATKKGWAVIEKQSGQVKTYPKNFCKNLLSDMVQGLVSDFVDDELVGTIDTAQEMSALIGALGFFDDPVIWKPARQVYVGGTGMSTSSGGHTGANMDLHPVSNYKPGRLVMDPVEQNIDFLLSREGVLGSFFWSTSDGVNKQMYAFNLDSFFGCPHTQINVPIYTLNQFQFWHATIALRLYVWKTIFHTGRLRVVYGYTYSTDDLPDNARNSMNTEVLNFDSDTNYVDFFVPWEALTDYLRTYDGPRSFSGTVQGFLDFAMGCIRIEVANQLCVANETAATTVDCLLTMRLIDARVAVPKFVPVVMATTDIFTEEPYMMYAQSLDAGGDMTELVEAPDFEVDEPFPDRDMVEEEEPGFGPEHSNLDLGAQFEFLVGNVLDLCRRFVSVNPYNSYQNAVPQEEGSGITYVVSDGINYVIPVSPPASPLTLLYRGYAGGVVYRIVSDQKFTQIHYNPSYANTNIVSTSFIPNRADTTRTNVYNKLSMYRGKTLVGSFTIDNVSDFQNAPAFPTEIVVPSGGSTGYIDVVCPYQEHVMFLTRRNNSYLAIGNLSFNTSGTSRGGVRVYAKVADDGTFGIFCPPTGYYENIVSASSSYYFGGKVATEVNGYYC